MIKIFESTWQHLPAVTLESPLMRVVIIPDLGAKIVSLFDKIRQYEWLAPPMRPLKKTIYGAVFKDQDMSGWDEMMPTIDACAFDGIKLPDHGEVWSIPWTVENTSVEALLSVCGTAMSYRFTRSAELVADNFLQLSYTLQNTAEVPLPYLWAAHPQFIASPDMHIILPSEVNQMVNIIIDDPLWGESGAIHAWPQAQSNDGIIRRLDQVAGAENHACRKFYVQPNQHIGWAMLYHTGLGCRLRLDWQPADIPYFGLWVDEGMVNSSPVAALEPATGYYDSLERAAGNGSAPILAPGAMKQWCLIVSLQ